MKQFKVELQKIILLQMEFFKGNTMVQYVNKKFELNEHYHLLGKTYVISFRDNTYNVTTIFNAEVQSRRCYKTFETACKILNNIIKYKIENFKTQKFLFPL